MANSSENDPTIRRIVGFADLWGYGSLTVINLFAKISKKPKILKYCHDPIGPRNDFEINKNLRHWSNNHLCDLWIGWGVNGKLMNRNNQVLKKIRDYDSKTPYVIGLTKEGHPCHPLYISKQSKLIHYYQN
ncbi:hypothetical protein EV08_0207 [Prochlorococcus marinus str. SS2]|nr:hypothetical protein EV08_0207 [Prochlorococcus marinus str. SS2]